VHPDPLDPNLIDFSPPERRIYGDDRAQTWHVVDEEDYFYLLQWTWSPKFTNCRQGKYYLRRSQRLGSAVLTVYLHIEVMRRSGVIPPSSAHILVDHRNGDSTICRRGNLRWATSKLNRQNRYGSHYYGDLALV